MCKHTNALRLIEDFLPRDHKGNVNPLYREALDAATAAINQGYRLEDLVWDVLASEGSNEPSDELIPVALGRIMSRLDHDFGRKL